MTPISSTSPGSPPVTQLHIDIQPALLTLKVTCLALGILASAGAFMIGDPLLGLVVITSTCIFLTILFQSTTRQPEHVEVGTRQPSPPAPARQPTVTSNTHYNRAPGRSSSTSTTPFFSGFFSDSTSHAQPPKHVEVGTGARTTQAPPTTPVFQPTVAPNRNAGSSSSASTTPFFSESSSNPTSTSKPPEHVAVGTGARTPQTPQPVPPEQPTSPKEQQRVAVGEGKRAMR